MEKLILCLDPGSSLSAWCVIDTSNYEPLAFAKQPNIEIRRGIGKLFGTGTNTLIVEDLVNYGMKFSQVLITAFESGRIVESWHRRRLKGIKRKHHFLTRQTVKLTLCGACRKVGDAEVFDAVRARFDLPDVAGNKLPGPWKGMVADTKQAYALGVAWIDLERAKERIA